MILGLTGAFGSGKSTVLHFFSTRKWHCFDADAACHALYQEQPPQLTEELKRIFGEEVFQSSGEIDRKAVARIVFGDEEKLQALSRAVLPLLDMRMQREIADCRREKQNGIFELPLLYESSLADSFDAVLCVWTADALRAERLRGRGFTPENMRERDARQLDPALKLEKADYAVINNGSESELLVQLEFLLMQSDFQ